MSSAELVPVGSKRAALPSIQLPSPPPTRIYISGFEYLIQAPKVPLPPIANVVKVIQNWVGPAGRIAKNIFFQLIGTGGTASSSDPATLKDVANHVLAAHGSAATPGSWSSQWTLSSVTAKDCGGTSATGVSDPGGVVGGVSGGSLPPQSALVISWQIAASYRGGKPRTYVPGVPYTAPTPAGGSALDPTFCANAATAWNAFKNAINSHTYLGSTFTLGTVSYHHGHAVRPVPIFEQFNSCRVHERVDSQRRRSGKESSFPVTP